MGWVDMTTNRIITRSWLPAFFGLLLMVFPPSAALGLSVDRVDVFTDNRSPNDTFLSGYFLFLDAQVSDPLGPSNITSVTATPQRPDLPRLTLFPEVPGFSVNFSRAVPYTGQTGRYLLEATNNQGEKASLLSHDLDKPLKLDFPTNLATTNLSTTPTFTFTPPPGANSFFLHVIDPVARASIFTERATFIAPDGSPFFQIPPGILTVGKSVVLRGEARQFDLTEPVIPGVSSLENRSTNSLPFTPVTPSGVVGAGSLSLVPNGGGQLAYDITNQSNAPLQLGTLALQSFVRLPGFLPSQSLDLTGITLAPGQRLFTVLDRNGDGVLTAADGLLPSGAPVTSLVVAGSALVQAGVGLTATAGSDQLAAGAFMTGQVGAPGPLSPPGVSLVAKATVPGITDVPRADMILTQQILQMTGQPTLKDAFPLCITDPTCRRLFELHDNLIQTQGNFFAAELGSGIASPTDSFNLLPDSQLSADQTALNKFLSASPSDVLTNLLALNADQRSLAIQDPTGITLETLGKPIAGTFASAPSLLLFSDSFTLGNVPDSVRDAMPPGTLILLPDGLADLNGGTPLPDLGGVNGPGSFALVQVDAITGDPSVTFTLTELTPLSQAVPEPAILMLLGPGLASLVAWHRRLMRTR